MRPRESFFENYDEAKKIDFLFRFVQYVERQVVLFDALEDAAFDELNELQGAGTLKELEARVWRENKIAEFVERLESFRVRPVLTAHPTQFYPGAVLGIINDLVEAIEHRLLVQPGLVPLALGAAQLDAPVSHVDGGPLDRVDERRVARGADVQVLRPHGPANGHVQAAALVLGQVRFHGLGIGTPAPPVSAGAVAGRLSTHDAGKRPNRAGSAVRVRLRLSAPWC